MQTGSRLDREAWARGLLDMIVSGWRTRLLVLWISGVSLRITVLAVPPLLAQIHHHLHLTETEVGSLTGMPVLLLALAAVPGSLMVARLGARRALLLGLATVAVAGAARGLIPSVPLLFAATFVMGLGVAISQPCLPSLVKAWVPHMIGLGTATFANGMLIGEIIPVAITAPLILPALANGYQASLAFWSIPVLLTALCVLLLTRNEPLQVDAPPVRWWPDWRTPTTWRVGLTLGGAAVAYWGANAFIPDFLRVRHHGAFITPALTALNLVQLPASFAVAALPRRLVARKWPLTVAGSLILVTTAGVITLPPIGLVISAGLLGFSTALVFVLTLALPSLLADSDDTHRMSAAVFTISYLCPFAGSLISGGLWDVTGISQAAFAPLAIGGVMVLLAPSRLDFSRARHAVATGDREVGVLPV